MPQESVHPAMSPEVPYGRYDLRVKWEPDNLLQIGIEEQAGFSLVTALYGDVDQCERIARDVMAHMQIPPEGIAATKDYHVQLGRQLLNIVESVGTTPKGSYTGVWVTLDRSGANRLIRLVRRARGAVFGEDE